MARGDLTPAEPNLHYLRVITPSNTGNPQAAVFLDRDGTLIEDMGYLSRPDQIRLYADTIDALLLLQKSYRLFVITNQVGVATGEITAEQVSGVNRALDRRLAAAGVRIEEWYVCPHAAADNCGCRKPSPAFLHRAAADYGLDLARSFVVGDHPSDVYTADPVGAFGMYLLTGHGSHHVDELPPERLIFHTISAAAEWITAHPNQAEDLHRSIRKAADALRRGGVVAFPTETVYGLGADALNPTAVARVFEAKGRPLDDPLIVHVAGRDQVPVLVTGLTEQAEQLMDRFWPGPLTLVLPKSDLVPDIVTSGSSTVALRFPANPWAQELIRLAASPVAAPSANLFGRTSPTTARHVEEQLGGRYDSLVDSGACRVGVESTVLSLTGPEPVLLRPGGTTVEEIAEAIGPVACARSGGAHGPRVESPGMLPSHYAPATPLRLVEDVAPYAADPDAGLVVFREPSYDVAGPVIVLSPRGSLREAAANLYRALRELDGRGLTAIVAERLPEEGLGRAVNDRMRRAASSGR